MLLKKEMIMKLQLKKASSGVALLVLSTLTAVTACGESNPSPSDEDDIINPEGGATASGGRSSSSGGSTNGSGGRVISDGGANGEGDGDGDGDGDTDTAGDTDSDTGGDTDGNDGSGGNLGQEPERENCSEDPNGTGDEIGECWDLAECNGVTTVQFLNQCQGEGSCIGRFDNESRIEGFDGDLPPLN